MKKIKPLIELSKKGLYCERGDFYIVQTSIRGDVFLRVSIMNPMTTIEHLKELITEIEAIGLILINN